MAAVVCQAASEWGAAARRLDASRHDLSGRHAFGCCVLSKRTPNDWSGHGVALPVIFFVSLCFWFIVW
jgi:hypothetical protein